MYTIVATVNLYEDFMPWCQSSHILCRKHDDNYQGLLDAEIEVGFKFFVEKYILHVQLAKATQPNQSKYPYIPFLAPLKKDPHPNLYVIFFYFEEESYICAIKLQSSFSTCTILTKLKFLDFVPIASSLLFPTLDVHGF
jgi:ribosome-associated toxin RatA of RatAB toxin-antitoxin module